jgi:hypothetical protein
MGYAIVSLALGAIAYAAVALVQSPEKRSDSDTWKDFLGISFVCSLALLGFLFWSAMGVGPNASGASIIDNLFNHRRARGFWIPFAGVASVAFTICALVHVVVLKVSSRHGSASDA